MQSQLQYQILPIGKFHTPEEILQTQNKHWFRGTRIAHKTDTGKNTI